LETRSGPFFSTEAYGHRSPSGTLFEGSDGFIYGTTRAGGGLWSSGCVFRFSKGGFTDITVLHSFGDCEVGGAEPRAGVIEGSDGALYGTTYLNNVVPAGGCGLVDTRGTVFRLSRDGTNFTTLKFFAGIDGDGSGPEAGLLLGKDGVLYGTTNAGGDTGHGTVFALYPDARSKIMAVSQDANGGMSLRAVGAAGAVFRLQSTTSIEGGA
jgi:uncharacterized repeat protein (TIGR03803 family)